MEPVPEVFKLVRGGGGVWHEGLGTVQGTTCVFVPAATLQGMIAQPTKSGEKTNLEPLKSMKLGVDIVVHNYSSGSAEVHTDWDDVWEGIEGCMRFIVGGQLDSTTKKEEKPGEFRANSIIGGREVVLGPGDQLIIPAGTPHQNMCWDGVAKAGIVKRLRKSLLDDVARLQKENECFKDYIRMCDSTALMRNFGIS